MGPGERNRIRAAALSRGRSAGPLDRDVYRGRFFTGLFWRPLNRSSDKTMATKPIEIEAPTGLRLPNAGPIGDHVALDVAVTAYNALQNMVVREHAELDKLRVPALELTAKLARTIGRLAKQMKAAAATDVKP